MGVESIFLEFDDSFSLNIASNLYECGIKHRIVRFDEVEKIKIKPIYKYQIIVGPGPGNPKDYPDVLHFLEKNISKKNIYFLGICLGHQLISLVNGGELFYLSHPVHGQSFQLPKVEYFEKMNVRKVQYYNSIGVRENSLRKEIATVKDRGHIISTRGENFITYQFHPESVGTDNSLNFYEPMLKWSREKIWGKNFLN